MCTLISVSCLLEIVSCAMGITPYYGFYWGAQTLSDLYEEYVWVASMAIMFEMLAHSIFVVKYWVIAQKVI